MEITIYDQSEKVIEKWIDVFILDGFSDQKKLTDKYTIKFAYGPNLVKSLQPDAIVSETNETLSFNNETVRNEFKSFRRETLPIGSCMLTAPAGAPLVILTPTVRLQLDEDTSASENAQLAMYSVVRFLYWYNKHNIGPKQIKKIMVPCLCVSSGKMDPSVAAMQTFTALETTLKPRFVKKTPGENFHPNGYILDN
jgi:hypothetical protein